MDRTQQIAELNDKCRQYLGASGRLVVSGGMPRSTLTNSGAS